MTIKLVKKDQTDKMFFPPVILNLVTELFSIQREFVFYRFESPSPLGLKLMWDTSLDVLDSESPKLPGRLKPPRPYFLFAFHHPELRFLQFFPNVLLCCFANVNQKCWLFATSNTRISMILIKHTRFLKGKWQNWWQTFLCCLFFPGKNSYLERKT